VATCFILFFSHDFERFRDSTLQKLIDVDHDIDRRFSALKNLTEQKVSSLSEAYKGAGSALRDVSQQVSILPIFCEQFLRAQIPKAQKNTDSLTVFFVLLGSARVKAFSY